MPIEKSAPSYFGWFSAYSLLEKSSENEFVYSNIGQDTGHDTIVVLFTFYLGFYLQILWRTAQLNLSFFSGYKA